MNDSSPSAADPFGQIADEFVAAFRQGKRPSVEEFIRRYPEHAEEIREILPTLVLMEKARSAEDTDDPRRPGGAAPLPQLGDYQILREIGRGGMGVVYEAQQLSLGRHVAIKVLPSHALLDVRQLARFQREARSAAKLHHTNIVSVFGVGQQDGLHYYVMQFIAGQSVDVVRDALRRLRQSGGKLAPTQADPPDRPTPIGEGVSAAEVACALLTGPEEREEGGGRKENRKTLLIPPSALHPLLSRHRAVCTGRALPGLACRWPRPWPTPPARASCIATSSRRTCCWTARATSG
jgi:hypothetical protein